MKTQKKYPQTISIGHPNYDDMTDYDSQLYITSSGTMFASKRALKTSRLNGRDDYHMIYIEKGRMIFRINEIEYNVHEGAVAFIDYGIPHEYLCGDDGDVLYHWLHFKGNMAHSFLQDFSLNKSCIFQFDTDNYICTNFKNITYELCAQRDMYLKRCRILLTEILLQLSKNIRNHGTAQSKSFNKIETIQSIMRTNNCLDMSVDDFAKICHLSKSRFIKTFQQATGYTPIEYRNITVINKSKWHLRNTTMTVTEISNSLGFMNPSYFSTLFKKHTGYTPREYRNIYNKIP